MVEYRVELQRRSGPIWVRKVVERSARVDFPRSLAEIPLGSGFVAFTLDGTDQLKIKAIGDQPMRVSFAKEPFGEKLQVDDKLDPLQPELLTSRSRVTITSEGDPSSRIEAKLIQAEAKAQEPFVPFAEQRGSKIHRIRVEGIEFPLPPIGELGVDRTICTTCEQPFTIETRDFVMNWNKQERLECSVANVPYLFCRCPGNECIYDESVRQTDPIRRPLVYAIEMDSVDEARAFGAQFNLSNDDLLKVEDFILNRWVPYDRAARMRSLENQ